MTFGSSHLARPERLPFPRDGEPWGGEAVTLSIAGVTFHFEGPDAARGACW